MSNIVIRLLTEEQLSVDLINKYCIWSSQQSPFKTLIDDTFYARTQDVKSIVEKPNLFINHRSHNIRLYQDLGSQRLVDSGERSKYVRDNRLLITWLHNPQSVALALLSNQHSFNAFVNSKLSSELASRYSMGYLNNLYMNYLDELTVSDYLYEAA